MLQLHTRISYVAAVAFVNDAAFETIRVAEVVAVIVAAVAFVNVAAVAVINDAAFVNVAAVAVVNDAAVTVISVADVNDADSSSCSYQSYCACQ